MTPKEASFDIFRYSSRFINPAQCVQEMVNAYTDYLKVAEEEKTKRREIEAWEKATLEKIQAQRDLVIGYLDRSFDERSSNFSRLFAVLDKAMAAGNNEQLASTLNSITELAKSSPFKDLANLNTVQAALDDPDHEWVF